MNDSPETDDATARASRVWNRASVASIAGSTLEYYDFTIYGLASALVFAHVFFPTASPGAGTLASFATFGVGFLTRPLGGLLFGHFGDRMGRKNILMWTLMIMGGSTVAIGFLPGYDAIGMWAPALLVALRLLQGLAYGGEWAGAVLMSSEHGDSRRTGLFASVPQVGLSVGVLLGNSVFLAMGRGSFFESWGWRTAFWSGGLLLIVGVLVRTKIGETPEFTRNAKAKKLPKAPLVEVVRRYPLQVLLSAVVVGGISTAGYTMVTYTVGFADQAGAPSWLPLTGVMIGSVIQLVTMPTAGALSDRFGRQRVFVTGLVVLGAISLFLFPMLGSGSVFWMLVPYVVNFGIVHAVPQAVFPSLLVESFAARIGYSGLSLGSQLGNVLGGLAPFLAALVVGSTGSAFALGVALCLVLFLAAVCAMLLVRLNRAKLGGSSGERALDGAHPGPTATGVTP